ncbi:MAG: hydrogenase maturation protease [Candidatus Limnocylindrales bacterium]|jgi:hydrogenase maturation protease
MNGGPEGTLIVGYGNALRGDDGMGWHAVQRLSEDRRLSGAQVLWRHQLTPELADDLSRASLAVLIDIDVELEAGAVSVRRLDSAPDTGSAWSHHIEPASLVSLAHELYGATPAVFVVSVGAGSLEVGDRLSPAVERALPEVVDAVVAIVAGHGARASDL